MAKEPVFYTHCTEMEVPFFHVDALQIAWHGHYIKYFEVARCAMLASLGYTYYDMKDDGYMWPIVDVRVKYMKPARFGQLIKVHCDLVEFENRLKINYRVEDALSGERLTKGYTVQLAVDLSTQEACFVTPERWQQKMKAVMA